MVLKPKTVFLIGLAIAALWFLYIERTILAPFILGAVFAYIFNPVINFFSHRVKLPRTISILIIYGAIISLLAFLSQFLARQIIDESSQLKIFIANLSSTLRQGIGGLPLWLRPAVEDSISSFEKLEFITSFSILNFFPAVISRAISFIVFLFSGFYFLKEGKNMYHAILNFMPKNYRFDVEVLFRKINNVLSAYLRGQIFLIFLVSLILFIALSILQVRFALILAIFSGIVEIIPIIGPITAGTVAVVVAFTAGNLNFSLSPILGAVTVAIVYFVIRHFQDYFINPFVMGRITRLHPLIVLFAVLAGEHIWGIMGILLAVPAAAIVRILLEFSLEKINKK